MPVVAHVLFAAAVVWCLVWSYKAARSLTVLLLLVALGVVHAALAARGVYADPTAFPPPQMALLAPVLLALVLCAALPSGRRWMRGLPLFALTAIHVLRIPVELVLHQGYEAGLLPRDMTYAGFNFDILSGISAALLLPWLRSARPPGRAVLIGWNIACLALLAIVVTTAVLSIPSSVQRINFDRPNVLVTALPWVLLPAVLVPVVLWAHVSALIGLFGRDVPKGSG
ncbi:MAG: hypothetical protein IPJ87_10605 [Flavobacteriales bacterium]|nr:hypothetical protein [Flavobacteriales bacterium]MBK7942304.1 hypothetical protein [Flavobacteriales bacterium]MBK8948115.1 hypothetical protein [Flavobacteriales bacterium]MBK9699294.1 hypothetical protein [Flavobacteriales bacterium]